MGANQSKGFLFYYCRHGNVRYTRAVLGHPRENPDAGWPSAIRHPPSAVSRRCSAIGHLQSFGILKAGSGWPAGHAQYRQRRAITLDYELFSVAFGGSGDV